MPKIRRSNRRRRAGIFCAVSSLPSRGGIGDFGPSAYQFVDWLAAAGQSYWQILPLTLPDAFGSPYASSSSRAGDWKLISPELLVRKQLLPRSAWRPGRLQSTRIHHDAVERTKKKLLERSFEYFQAGGTSAQHRAFERWRQAERGWLAPYTTYAVLEEAHQGRQWGDWPPRYQNPVSAQRSLSVELRRRQDFFAYMQWIFFQQWGELKRYANRQGLRVIGDLPFYVRHDSVDVWAHPELFKVDYRGRPIFVAGVPPGLFTDLGQKWGYPVFDWPAHRRTDFAWWYGRIRQALRLYDVLRIDHFRGYEHTWWIPAKATDGRAGHWVRTPWKTLLAGLVRRWPARPFLVEDLGLYSKKTDLIRAAYKLRGMRVFQFGWRWPQTNIHQPARVTADYYFYTSTHDSNTIMGWWRDEATAAERQRVKAFLPPHRSMHWALIEAVYRSRGFAAMIQIQDLLGRGTRDRMNLPGTIERNWSWRLPVKACTPALARRLRKLTTTDV